ncbi:MAG: PAS domain S-box protein [Saprospiraceae bacterium]|nr:PAS domain S-box protein [Saprospiraceae bacterium]
MKTTWILIGLGIILLAFGQVIEIYNLYYKENSKTLLSIFIAINCIVITVINFAMFRISKWLKKLRKTEKEKLESENRFQLLFDNSGDEIYLEDFDANIIEVNSEATRKLGFTKEELLNKNFADLKTPKYTGMVKKNLKIVITTGKHVFETEHLTKNGKVIFLEMSSRVIDYMGKKAILSIGRDITERKDIERKIASAIIETEEKERRRFAADLHDDLAPLLSTIKLYIDLLKKGNFNKISPQETIQSIDELIEKAIVSTREISNNIMPSILQDFGLIAAVKDFCTYINNTKSINIILDCEQYKLTGSRIEETVLFQSIKELVHNTLKHSNASKIDIFLESNDDHINLFYKDNGIGFDVNDKTLNPTGLGLNNIVNKVKTINGLTMIKSEPDQGMSMLITLKVK